MSTRLIKSIGVVLLAGALLNLPVYGQGADLDSWGDEELDADLEAELDDIFEYGFLPDQQYSIRDLHRALLAALSDQGDEDDPLEQRIALADLEAEMREADTTLSDVVWTAVVEADQIASGRRSPIGAVAWADASAYSPWSEPLAFAIGPIAREDGMTYARQAMSQVKGDIRSTIRLRR
jgi:hypothetical protein